MPDANFGFAKKTLQAGNKELAGRGRTKLEIERAEKKRRHKKKAKSRTLVGPSRIRSPSIAWSEHKRQTLSSTPRRRDGKSLRARVATLGASWRAIHGVDCACRNGR